MKNVFVLLSLMFTLLANCLPNGSKSEYELFLKQFSVAKGVVNMKTYTQYVAKEISQEDAYKYLALTQRELEYYDFAYDEEADDVIDYKMATLPYSFVRFNNDSIVVLVYYINYNYNYADMYGYDFYIETMDNSGLFIDKMKIGKFHFPEGENEHYETIILNDSIFKVFNYSVNERFARKGIDGLYYTLDDSEPQTKVTIVEYKICKDGKIVKTGNDDMKYVNESVLLYGQYHKDSDDPMNEYK